MRFAWLLPLSLAACGGGGAEPTVHPSIVPALQTATGWTFKSAPVFESIDRARLASYLESKMDERTAAAGRALQLLGVLPKKYDLAENIKKLYSQEILALYDLKERKVFLVREAFEKEASAEDKQLRAAGKPESRDLVVAHELVHALQHQHDPQLELLEDRSADFDDVRTAVHAQAEGEATLHMYAPLGKVDHGTILRGLRTESDTKLRDQPEFMRHLLFSPYVRGFQYVEGSRKPRPSPLSTEQIQDPRADAPVAVFLPDLSAAVGGGRKLAYETVLGQFHLPYALAGLGLGTFHVQRWGGDRLQFYEKDGGAGVAILLLRWDVPAVALALYAQASEIPDLGVAWQGKDVAIVAGLGKADAVAREALGRRVAAPFTSVAQLRQLRGTAKFPAAAPAGTGDLDRAFEALAVDLPDPKAFADFYDSIAHRAPRIARLAAARYNLARPGQEPFGFGLGEAEFSGEELDLLVRNGGRTDVNSPVNARLAEGLERFGKGWPPETVLSLVRWYSLQKPAEFPGFLKKHASVPGVVEAAARAHLRAPLAPPLRAVFLQAVEEGRLTTEQTQPYMVGAEDQALFVESHLMSSGRRNPRSQSVLESQMRNLTAFALPARVVAKWASLDLTPSGRATLLALACRHPGSLKQATELLRPELAKAEPGFWEAFSKPLVFSRDLPHLAELRAAIDALSKDPQAPPSLKKLAADLRR